MTRLEPAFLGLFVALAAAAPALAADSANGRVHLTQADFAVIDGVAYAEGDRLVIALSDVAFNNSEMRQDGRVDASDRISHDGQSIALYLENGQSTTCADAIVKVGDSFNSGKICNSGLPDSLKITKLDDQRVAGRLNFTTSEIDVDVTFDLSIRPTGD